jgi:hypothetical protein
LLVPLSARKFTVTDVGGGQEVREKQRSLIVITSNEERDLPQAFERRCVVFRIPPHGEDKLRRITDLHLRQSGQQVAPSLLDDLLRAFEKARHVAKQEGLREPSTAEFIDAVLACAALPEKSFSDILPMIFEKNAHD